MFTRFIILFTIATTFSCRADNYQVSDKEIYEFLNSFLRRTDFPQFGDIKYLADSEIEEYNFSWTKEDSLEFIKRDTIFSEIDVSYISQQAKAMHSFKLNENKIANKKIIRLNSFYNSAGKNHGILWDKFQRQFSADEFATFSLPLFSRDKSLVIFRVNYYTQYGGGGGLYLFTRVDKEWKLMEQLAFWDN